MEALAQSSSLTRAAHLTFLNLKSLISKKKLPFFVVVLTWEGPGDIGMLQCHVVCEHSVRNQVLFCASVALNIVFPGNVRVQLGSDLSPTLTSFCLWALISSVERGLEELSHGKLYRKNSL